MAEDTPQLSVEHFRNTLAAETGALKGLCEKWASILDASPAATAIMEEDKEATERREEFLGAVRATIGQAKLLMSQRFKQFSDLIDHCEFQTGHLPTRLNDLSGFWEMISFQVEDVLQKFNKLDAQQQQQQPPIIDKTQSTCQKIVANNNNNNDVTY